MAEENIEETFTEEQFGPGPKGKKIAKKAATINRYVLTEETLNGLPNVNQAQAEKRANNPYVLTDETLSTLKKKDGGTSSSNGESVSQLPLSVDDTGATTTPLPYTDISAAPGMGQNILNPVSLLNKPERDAFIKENGYVRSPEAQKELAATIRNKAADPTEEIISFLEEGYDNVIKNTPTDPFGNKIQEAAVKAVQDFQKQTHGKSMREAVTTALQNNDMGSIKKLINDTYSKQNDQLLKKYDAAPYGNVIPSALRSIGLWDAVYDEYDTESAPLRQQKDKVDQIFTAISSRKYSYLNPSVKEEYNANYLKAEVDPNQFSALSFYRENEPEKAKQFEIELDKAARPTTYGMASYDKNNPDYKYIQYQLDKKGAEINSFASAQNIQDARAQKEVLDKTYGTQIAQINEQIKGTTDLAARQALQQQAQTLTDQYNANPINLSLADSQQAFQASQNVVDQKYPEQARREREFKVKDILQGDGKSIVGEVVDRLKWLGRETGSGIANIFGIDEAAFGGSRNYARDLRIGEEKQSDLYQPQSVSAQQALYKLNFNNEDYEALNSIKNSDLSKKEKVDAMTNYVKQNEQRLTYEFNADAGKNNWTAGAIGNQIADVGTQVAYQAALMLLTEGAGKLLSTAKPAAAIGATEAAGLDASAAAIGDEVVVGINKSYAALGDKLRKFGSVFGTTYATTYQSAYVNGLQEGLSPEEAQDYANQISIVNGLTETISPDIDVVKRAAKGVNGLAKGFSSDILTKAGTYKSIGKGFVKGYAENVIPETVEEYAAAIGEYGIDALHNINQDDLNSLTNRIQNAVTSTMIGMAPLGIFSGVNTARRIPALQKESLYRAGMYPETMTTEINGLAVNGNISQEEANKRIKIVNTSSEVIRNMPSIAEGVKMDESQRQNYLYNELQKNALQEKLANATDANTKSILSKQISGLEETNAQLVESATIPESVPSVPRETIPDSSTNATLLEEARAAALNDMAPTMAGVFAEDIEAGLQEAAQQLNASESEAKTAREFYGDRVSDIALQLFPKETVEAAQERRDIIASGRNLVENVNPVLERMNNADYINENELNAAADQIYSLLDRTEKSTYTPEQQASISNLFEPIISKIEGYEFRTKTETSTVTEKVPVQVAKQTQRTPVKPALEQTAGSEVGVTTQSGERISGVLNIEGGNYVVTSPDGNKTVLGEKAISDRDLSLPSEEEMANPITLDENDNVSSVTVKTRDGSLVTINDPAKALDIAIQLSSNVIDEVTPEEFDTIYKEIQKEISKEVLVNQDQPISSPLNTTTNEISNEEVRVVENGQDGRQESLQSNEAKSEGPSQEKVASGKSAEGKTEAPTSKKEEPAKPKPKPVEDTSPEGEITTLLKNWNLSFKDKQIVQDVKRTNEKIGGEELNRADYLRNQINLLESQRSMQEIVDRAKVLFGDNYFQALMDIVDKEKGISLPAKVNLSVRLKEEAAKTNKFIFNKVSQWQKQFATESSAALNLGRQLDDGTSTDNTVFQAAELLVEEKLQAAENAVADAIESKTSDEALTNSTTVEELQKEIDALKKELAEKKEQKATKAAKSQDYYQQRANAIENRLSSDKKSIIDKIKDVINKC